jgi:hypothetical protein
MDGQHAVPPDGVEHDGLTELDAVDLAKRHCQVVGVRG